MRGHVHKRVKTISDGRQVTYWYVVINLGIGDDGKRRQKWHGSYATRREADKALVGILRDLEQRTYVEPASLTLAEYVSDQWLPQMRTQVKASTFDSYQRNLKLHVLPALGNRQLQAITSGQLTVLYNQLLDHGRRNGPTGRGLSAKTVRYVHTIVSKLFGDAVDLDVIARNPAARAKPPRPERGSSRIRFWTAQQLTAFLDGVAVHRLYPLWHLAAMTGMRRGELLGLRWADVDFDNARLAVRQTLISVAYKPQLSTPKTHRARVIDLDVGTVAVLRRHALGQQTLLAAEGLANIEDLVFDDGAAAPIHPESVRQTFERLVAKAAVPRIRFHDLRHTHATIALRAGVPVKVISERLGHANPAFTLQQYAHVIPGMQAEAAQDIADLVGCRICTTCGAKLDADGCSTCGPDGDAGPEPIGA